jgi:hypothetical protein
MQYVSKNIFLGVLIAILFIATVVFGVLWMQARGELRSTNQELRELQEQVNALEEMQGESENPVVNEEWKTYRNEEFGFEFKHPQDWFVYDQAKFERDHKIRPCSEVISIKKSIILSRKDLGSCVGFAPTVRQNRPGDFFVDVHDNEWVDFPNTFKEPDKEIITVDGITAVKELYAGRSRPTAMTVEISMNYNGKGYHIEFRQDGLEGNYDPIFDQILSTFKFID